jgi:hypothetical protein
MSDNVPKLGVNTSVEFIRNMSMGNRAEVANFSAGNYNFITVPRFIAVNIDGVLVVDDAFGNTGVTIPVFAGYNPIQIKRIYNVGSDILTVVGWS